MMTASRRLIALLRTSACPVIDGFELWRLARLRLPDLPVILITGRHEDTDQRRALASGNHGFFRKPFDALALLAAVGRAVFQDRGRMTMARAVRDQELLDAGALPTAKPSLA
jgi:CheY-like chemotaxis protein